MAQEEQEEQEARTPCVLDAVEHAVPPSHLTRDYIPGLVEGTMVDLSVASEQWQRLSRDRDHPTASTGATCEACVLAYLAQESPNRRLRGGRLAGRALRRVGLPGTASAGLRRRVTTTYRTEAMPRTGWALVVTSLLVLAVWGPVKIISRRTEAGSETKTISPHATQATVHMAGLLFSPGTLVVSRGAAVVFDNDDVAPHTVTENRPGGIDSGVLSPRQSFSLVLQAPITYHCSIHPFMKATIELEG